MKYIVIVVIIDKIQKKVDISLFIFKNCFNTISIYQEKGIILDLEIVSNRLAFLMEERKLNASQLSKISDVSVDDIDFILDPKNSKDILLENIVKIATSLNVSIDFLVGSSDEVENENELVQKVNAFLSLSKNINPRPLSSKKAEKAIVMLKNEKVSLKMIKNFLKSELDIDVSEEAIRRKYNSIVKKAKKD